MADSIGVLAGFGLKSTLILLLAAVWAAVLRRKSASVRHMVWLSAMGALALLPLAAGMLPIWQPGIPPALREALPAGRTVVDVIGAAQPSSANHGRIMWMLWGAGALVLLLRMGWDYARAALLARAARPFPARAAAPVRLTGAVPVPFVCGILRRTILLPAEAVEWTAERLRLVLAHESMHVVRFDTLSQALAQLVCALYWPNPLVWRAAAQLRNECERAADDGVLAEGEKATVYAGHLIDIVRALAQPARVPQGGIHMARTSELENRLKSMFSSNRSHNRAGWKPAFAAIALALALLLPLAALRAPAQIAGASLAGVVKDASGATVPRAAVTLLEMGSDRKEFAITNDTGEFLFSPLQEGLYAVQVAKPGFARLEQKGIEVSAARPARVDIVLNVGKVQETLTISAEGNKPTGVAVASGAPKRIRVGGSVQATKIEKMVQPKYPPECKTQGIEGTVLLRGTIGRDGAILNLEPINKLVDQRLVGEAMEAVRQWRYQPTLLNGEPVEVITEIQINFILQ